MDKVRVTTKQRLAQYQDLMAKHYNSKVRHKDFKIEDRSEEHTSELQSLV